MNRWKLMYCAKRLLGNRLLSRLQQVLKYELNFRNVYSNSSRKSETKENIVVFCIDGKTIHGGMSDRLRGLMSTEKYCEARGKKMLINWTYPFRLSDYLDINGNVTNVNWGGYVSLNRKDVAFRFFNSYSFIDNDKNGYFEILDTKKNITHVYSNVTLDENHYHEQFNYLFSPSEALKKEINKCLKEIEGKYISITFRFIGLLGDFKDTYNVGILSETEKHDYIERGIKAIHKLWRENCNDIRCVLVTADSNLFLEEVRKLSFVYVISGTVSHMDATKTDSYKLYLKSFLDFFMISKAQKCYNWQYGKMFGATRFAKTAALVGGKRFIEIVEKNNSTDKNEKVSTSM